MIYDPPLSFTGERQCAELQKMIQTEGLHGTIQLVVSSPLMRCLQTVVGAFSDDDKPVSHITTDPSLSFDLTYDTSLMTGNSSGSYNNSSSNSNNSFHETTRGSEAKGILGLNLPRPRFIASPLLTEIMDTVGDVGSNVNLLKERFTCIEFSLVQDHWWYHLPDGPYKAKKEPSSKVKERIKMLNQYLLSLPEQHIAVVGHSKFFMRWSGGKRMKNCQLTKFYLFQRGENEILSPTPPLDDDFY